MREVLGNNPPEAPSRFGFLPGDSRGAMGFGEVELAGMLILEPDNFYSTCSAIRDFAPGEGGKLAHEATWGPMGPGKEER